MDISSIYQLALLRLGNYEFQEGSPPALALHRSWPFVLALANARHDWSFCQVRKLLREKKDYGGGRYLFTLPQGCLKVKKALTHDGCRKIRDPELVAGGITTGEDGADGIMLDYQADLVSVAGELPENNPFFCDAVINLLASRVALNITGRADLAQLLEQEADRQFSEAIAHDKQQDWSNDKDPLTLLRRTNMLRRNRYY